MNHLIVFYYLIFIFLTQNCINTQDFSTDSNLVAIERLEIEYSDVSPTIKLLRLQQRHPRDSPPLRFGDDCKHDKECLADIHGSVACVSRKCVCLKGHVYNSNTNACYLSKKLGEECTTDEDCLALEFSYCKIADRKREEFDKCTCKAGRAPNVARDSCEKSSLLNDECDVDRDCRVVHSKCRRGKCVCEDKSKMSLDQNYCVIVDGTLVHSGCTDSSECKMDYAACLNRKCTCILNTVPNTDFTACFRVYRLHTDCKINNDCRIDHSFCDHGRCKCKAGFLQDNYGLQCVEIKAGLGEKCVQNSGCVNKHANCVYGFCECLQGYRELRRKCVKERVFGDPCKSTDECYYINSECWNEICYCIVGYEYINGNCIRLGAFIFSPCDDTHPCFLADRTLCLDNKCICNYGTFPALGNRECLTGVAPSLGKNVHCDVHSDCQIGNSVCRNYECVCKYSHYINKRQDTCLERDYGVPLLVSVCSKEKPCTIQGSECIENICTCRLSRIMSDDLKSCVIRNNVRLGDICFGNMDCSIQNSECVDGTCRCNEFSEDIYYNNKSCHVIARLGVSCKSSAECLVEFSTCYNKECVCMIGPIESDYYISTVGESRNCTLLSTNGESTITSIPCNNNTDCIPYEVPENETNYECVDNFCKYNLNVEEALEIVTVVGAKCRFHVECNIENAMCINHICTCTTVASHDRKRCLNRIEIGGECEEDLQCSSTQSICDQNVCKCKHGFIVDSSDANNTLCRQPNGIGFKCNTKTDCEVANSTCSDKQVCKCKIGFVVYEKNCWENSFTMLSPCRVDVQCHTNLGPDSQCQEGFCHCKSTYNFDKLHNYCVSPDVKGIVSKGIEMSSDRLHLTVFTLLLAQTIAWII